MTKQTFYKKKFWKIFSLIFISIGLIAYIYPFIPRSKPIPEATKITDTTYHFQDGSGKASMYLLLGEERALLIDTGFGLSQIDKAVEAITDLPVTVVNSHGHYDHVGSNDLFSDIYMNEKDWELYKYYSTPEAIKWVYDEVPALFRHFLRQEIQTTSTNKPVPVKPLPQEGYFDLGNRRVSFFDMPGHTPGSIVLHDHETNYLFPADSAAEHGLLLNLPLSLSVETYLESVKKLNAYVDQHKITTMYPGHPHIGITTDILKDYEKAAQDIVDGTVSDKVVYKGRYLDYTYKGVTISYFADKVYKTQE